MCHCQRHHQYKEDVKEDVEEDSKSLIYSKEMKGKKRSSMKCNGG